MVSLSSKFIPDKDEKQMGRSVGFRTGNRKLSKTHALPEPVKEGLTVRRIGTYLAYTVFVKGGFFQISVLSREKLVPSSFLSNFELKSNSTRGAPTTTCLNKPFLVVLTNIRKSIHLNLCRAGIS